MSKMRAKMRVSNVVVTKGGDGETTVGEKLTFHAVAASSYPADGSDEDNSYAKYSPSAELGIYVANPALFGKFEIGKAYYVDFTEAV